jgi:chemotaxis protein methyltransferase CheR
MAIKYRNLDEGERITPEAEFLTNEADFVKFIERLYAEEGIDLSQYKQNQMRRRINTLITQSGCKGYVEFLDKCKSEIELYRKFIDRITINVSEFFRNTDKYEILEKRFFAPLLERTKNPVIWSAGCSTGEEPYTLALLLEKYGATPLCKVLGWDFDRNALANAEKGEYEEKALATVPKDMLERYFEKVGPTRYRVKQVLKNRVRLERHNLLEDRFPGNVDIILCRNVVIYFREQAKHELFVNFGKALAKEGALMIGASERIPNCEEAGLRSPDPFFYVRKGSDHPESFGLRGVRNGR